MKTETGRLLYERAFLFLFVGNRIYDERPLFGLGKGYMEVFFLKKKLLEKALSVALEGPLCGCIDTQ